MSFLQPVLPAPTAEMQTIEHIPRQLRVKNPSNFEIFHACVNDLTGKDKLAKIAQYFLRLMTSANNIHGLGNPKIARSFVTTKSETLSIDDSTVIDSDASAIINTTSITYMLPLIAKLLSKSSTLLSKSKIQKMILLVLAFFTKKLSGLLEGLNIYRHLLRAGTIPFRVWKFTNHIRYSLNILLDKSKLDGPAFRLEKVVQYWTTKDMISQIANFWYAISDEILLIYRFKILLHGPNNGKYSNALFAWAEDHELYSWMATILLGLNNDWNKWLVLKSKESRIILNEKVKARTKRIVGNLKLKSSNTSGNNNRISSPDIENTDYDEDDDNEFDSLYHNQLMKIHHEMRTVYINSIRLSCDMIFDAKYIFHWDMYPPLHLSLAFTSGCLGLVNVWRSQRDRLLKEAIAKAEVEADAEADAKMKVN